MSTTLFLFRLRQYRKSWNLLKPVSKASFFPKSNIPIDTYTALPGWNFSQLRCFIVVIKASQRLWSNEKDQNIKFEGDWRRL